MGFGGTRGNYYERLSFSAAAAKGATIGADGPIMSHSISSASHVSSAQATAQPQTAQPTPQPARTSSTPQATKKTSLPHDTVNLSNQAQRATPARSTSDVNRGGESH